MAFQPLQLIGTTHCEDYSKVQVDAAWDTSGKTAFRWIFKGASTTNEQEGGGRFYAQSPLQAEAIAIREVIQKAKHDGVLHLWVELDCL